jgi:hypothetical protein
LQANGDEHCDDDASSDDASSDDASSDDASSDAIRHSKHYMRGRATASRKHLHLHPVVWTELWHYH